MNQYKIAAQLRNVPIEYLQQQMNNPNKDIPDYLLAAEMQRRNRMDMEARNQAALQAGQPQGTVMSNLMQQLQQQQMAAQQPLQQPQQADPMAALAQLQQMVPGMYDGGQVRGMSEGGPSYLDNMMRFIRQFSSGMLNDGSADAAATTVPVSDSVAAPASPQTHTAAGAPGSVSSAVPGSSAGNPKAPARKPLDPGKVATMGDASQKASGYPLASPSVESIPSLGEAKVLATLLQERAMSMMDKSQPRSFDDMYKEWHSTTGGDYAKFATEISKMEKDLADEKKWDVASAGIKGIAAGLFRMGKPEALGHGLFYTPGLGNAIGAGLSSALEDLSSSDAAAKKRQLTLMAARHGLAKDQMDQIMDLRKMALQSDENNRLRQAMGLQGLGSAAGALADIAGIEQKNIDSARDFQARQDLTAASLQGKGLRAAGSAGAPGKNPVADDILRIIANPKADSASRMLALKTGITMGIIDPQSAAPLLNQLQNPPQQATPAQSPKVHAGW